MILYLDASALVKRYVVEPGSAEIAEAISQASLIGTALISRAEVSAALVKAVRIGILVREEALAALQLFRSQWADLVRVQVTEAVVARADVLSWEYDLRGYDAVHLAASLLWQEGMGEPITMATFDRQLWEAARKTGLGAFPSNLL